MVESQRQAASVEESNLNAHQVTGKVTASDKTPVQSKGPPTIASRLGEMVWLLTQSPAHKHFSIGDLEWMLMPPLMLGQYKIFYKGGIPIALSLWAYLTSEDEERLLSSNRMRPEAWCGGEAQRLTATNSQTVIDDETPLFMQETQLWLIELIAPAANDSNKLREKILADLMTTVFKGRDFKLQVTDPVSGRKETQELGAFDAS